MHLTKIFYEVDEFCKQFEKQFEKKLLSDGQDKRDRAISMSLSEVMTIMIYFHQSGYKTLIIMRNMFWRICKMISASC